MALVFGALDLRWVDDWDQCNREGKIIHQLTTEGSFSRERLHAELGEQREIRRARAGDGGDRVQRGLRQPHNTAEMRQHFLRQVEVLVSCVCAGADAGDALVHRRRRVRHRANDGHVLSQMLLDLACGHRRGKTSD